MKNVRAGKLPRDREKGVEEAWAAAEAAFNEKKIQILPSFLHGKTFENHDWSVGNGRQQPSFRKEPETVP